MERASESGRTSNASDMRLRRVGVVRSVLKRPSLVPQRGDLNMKTGVKKAHKERSTIVELVIDEDLTGILDGIDGFSHLMVLYWAHMVTDEARSITRVHPMGRKEFPLTGVFATCSPARPNPISATAVQLIEHRGNVLVVDGLEAVDGSPLIDIKPYIPYYYRAHNVRMPDWVIRIGRELDEKSPSSGPAHDTERFEGGE